MEKTVKLITKTADKANFDNVDKYILNGGFKGLARSGKFTPNKLKQTSKS